MLDIRHLDKTFHMGTPNAVHALNDVSLNLTEGSFTVIVGSNGSGKSTLLNAIAGSFLPDAGRISLEGRDITRWPEYRRAAMIGRVFQDPFKGTAPGMTIAENLALAAKRGQPRGLSKALSRSVLTAFRDRARLLNLGLEDRLHTPIGGLSGGQRQALTLLMATWVKPSLLLLDEHTAALDPKSAAQIVRITDQIISEQNLTTFMVTHSMNQAASLGDRLIMMHRGQVIRNVDGTDKKRLRPDDLLAHFDSIRRSDALDESAAELLRASYL